MDDLLTFLHEYMEMDPINEVIAAAYIRMTWACRKMEGELNVPHLVVCGLIGSGKTRLLEIFNLFVWNPCWLEVGLESTGHAIRKRQERTIIVDGIDNLARAELSLVRMLRTPVIGSTGVQSYLWPNAWRIRLHPARRRSQFPDLNDDLEAIAARITEHY